MLDLDSYEQKVNFADDHVFEMIPNLHQLV